MENAVDDLTKLAAVNNVRFNQTKRAVVKYCGSLHRSLRCINTISEPEASFSFITISRIRSVDSVPSSVSTEHSSERVRRFLSSLFRVSRSVKGTHLSDSVFLY